MLNNWLVNPSGKPGHWHDLDLLQEHHNYWIKILYNSRDAHFDSNFLRKAVSLNIIGFRHLRERLEKVLGVKPSFGSHTSPSKVADINLLAARHQEDNVFTYRPGRKQLTKTKDIFDAGVEKLQTGHLEIFKARTSVDRRNVHDPSTILDPQDLAEFSVDDPVTSAASSVDIDPTEACLSRNMDSLIQ